MEFSPPANAAYVADGWSGAENGAELFAPTFIRAPGAKHKLFIILPRPEGSGQNKSLLK